MPVVLFGPCIFTLQKDEVHRAFIVNLLCSHPLCSSAKDLGHSFTSFAVALSDTRDNVNTYDRTKATAFPFSMSKASPEKDREDMSKLSQPLKAFINASFARPGMVAAPKQIRSVYSTIEEDANARGVGKASWLTISVWRGTLMIKLQAIG